MNKADKLFSVLRELTSRAGTRVKYGACQMVVVMEKNRAGKGYKDLRLEEGSKSLAMLMQMFAGFQVLK